MDTNNKDLSESMSVEEKLALKNREINILKVQLRQQETLTEKYRREAIELMSLREENERLKEELKLRTESMFISAKAVIKQYSEEIIAILAERGIFPDNGYYDREKVEEICKSLNKLEGSN